MTADATAVSEALPRRDLRGDIIREATKQFSEHGYGATSIRQIAEACECTKPALYYYFRSKEQLYREVIQKEVDALSGMIQEFTSQSGPIRPRLRESVEVFMAHALAHPEAMRLIHTVEMHAEEGAPDVSGAITGARELHFRMMATLIQHGIESGEIRDDVDPRDVAIALAGTVSFQFQLFLCGEEWSIDRVDRTIGFLFDGIAKR